MKLLPLGLCVLLASGFHALADVEIASSIRGFDIAKATAVQPTEGPEDTSRRLPTVKTKERRAATVRVVKEISLPAKFDRNGVPTKLRTENLGLTLLITVYPSPDGYAYRGELTLAEQKAGFSGETAYCHPSVLSAKTDFRGLAKNGKSLTIPVLTPGGKTAKLTFRIKNV